MRDGRASITAQLVAAARGLATLSRETAADSQDEHALDVVPGPARLALRALAASEQLTPWLSRATLAASLGLIDHVALRTAAIDAILRSHVARSASQVVLLGAGLDLRAYRMGCLIDSHVFEVDHPASQGAKRAHVASLKCRAQALTHVPVDFTRDDLDASLQAAGHDPERSSLWIWEGVVPYLQPPAIDATLSVIARRSPPGAELVMSYMTDDTWWWTFGQLSAAPLLSLMGEPLGTAHTPGEMATRVRSAGLSPIADTDTRDWYRTLGTDRGARVIIAYERLLHARRD